MKAGALGARFHGGTAWSYFFTTLASSTMSG